MPETHSEATFKTIGLPTNLFDTIDRLGFVTPTPIQLQAIPVALRGDDLIGIAQTGTGKTLAFGLPIAARLSEDRMALILAPTRELAEQIAVTFEKLNMRTALLIGGEGMQRQKQQLRSRPQVVVATPGRLEDHVRQGYRALKHVDILVLDEADRMLDMGFAPAIHRIIGYVPQDRQTMLFSATMPKEIAELAATYMVKPARIDIQPALTTAEGIDQELIFVQKDEKPEMLGDLLAEHKGTILVFARTRHGARKIAHSIRVMGHTAAEIHADRSLAQRRAALEGFKTGEHRVLVATDIAARGIDVKDIALVINYDVPEKPEDYIHRIGRTGRAGARGRAIMIATPEQSRDVRDIERLLRLELPLSSRSRARVNHLSSEVGQPPRRRRSGGSRPQAPQGGPAEQSERHPRPHRGSHHPRPTDAPKPEGAAPKKPRWRDRTAPPADTKPASSGTDRARRPADTPATSKPKWQSPKPQGSRPGPSMNSKPHRLNWASGRPSKRGR
jgi:ATP-dependent RNA helicase RhlE